MAGLTAAKVKELNQPGRYGDGGGGGLYLYIARGGSKSWVLRLRLNGTRTDKGLGGYPSVSLRAARKLANTYRAAVLQGRNPWSKTKTGKAPPIEEMEETVSIPTLREAAHKVHINDAGVRPASASRWIGRLESHVFEKLGDRLINEISRADLAAIIGPLRIKQFETARKTTQALRDVFKWSVAYEYRKDNPADAALEVLLPKVKPGVEHRPALHHSDVKMAIHRIRNSEARASTQLAFEFLILTAARSGEVRSATWSELDLESKTWTIPAARMKARRDHRVPLSTQAQLLLRRARELYRDSEEDVDFSWPVQVKPEWYIFPHPRSLRPLSENALSDRASKDRLNCVPHGFRSSFRDWAAELSGCSWEAIELSLAHAIGTSVTEAYFRTDLLHERNGLMQSWADYTDPMPPPF